MTHTSLEYQLNQCRIGLGQFIDISKYAKHIELEQRFETPDQTIKRSLDMHMVRYAHAPEDFRTNVQRAFEFVYSGHVLTSQRCAQFAGEAILRQNDRMFNCRYTPLDRLRAFSEVLYSLLCGCGVGYSVRMSHIAALPAIGRISSGSKRTFVVPDTIEGWADAVQELMSNAVAGHRTVFDYSLIRPKGSRLVTAGGIAPGPGPLRSALVAVESVLLQRQGLKLRPIDAFDIVCYLAEAVQAGGIRRSATICVFSPDDDEMMTAKQPGQFEWNGLNKQRSQANISAAMSRHNDNKSVFDTCLRLAAEGYGEPGFYFVEDDNHGPNPCVEIGLNSHCRRTKTSGFGNCNLTEIVASMCRSESEFVNAAAAAAIVGTAQAGYTRFGYIAEASGHIARSEALLGVSITGMHDNPGIAFDRDVLYAATGAVYRANKINANAIGLPGAARATCIKPSGTASLKAGCVGSGIHPHHARRYFRRVTVGSNEPAAMHFASVNGHMIEPGSNADTMRIIWPIAAPKTATTTVKEQSAAEFVADVIKVYRSWVEPGTFRPDSSPGLTHSVSATCTLRPDEIESTQATLWRNRASVAAMSFVGHAFDKLDQGAPREEVVTDSDSERWTSLAKGYKPVDWSSWTTDGVGASNRGLEPACAGGLCEA